MRSPMSPSTPPASYDLVIAADTLPVEYTGDDRHGRPRWRARGEAAIPALRRVAGARRGAWVGRAEGMARPIEPFPLDKLWVHPVHLPAAETEAHLRGHCATTLAPLYHDCMAPAVFERGWREAYRAVNRRFAERIAAIAAPGGVVWVHDYHLQLVPGQLRRLRPDLLVGFFLHTSFPPAEMFLRLPMRAEITRGLLGADLIGFQHHRAAANFANITRHLLRVPVGDGDVQIGGRRVRFGAYPMSIDVDEVERLAADPAVRAMAARLRADLGGPDTIYLAIGRLGHADGIAQVLDAYADLLAGGSADPERTVLILVTTPGEDGPAQERLRGEIDRRVAQINGTYSRVGRTAIHHTHRSLDRTELVSLYLAADAMLATPLRAGMTLPAKEFVAARTDGTGHLVLSEFTGTADDLPQALIVNPHDREALATAMRAARTGGRNPGMDAMRAHLRAADVNAWAGGFLSALGGCVAATYRVPAPGGAVDAAGHRGAAPVLQRPAVAVPEGRPAGAVRRVREPVAG